jgi:Ca2+-transporting ATPase
VLVIMTITLALTLCWPIARGLFRFGSLHANDLVVPLAAGVVLLGLLEWLKPHWRARLES